jgi:hypothetical protein
MLRSICCAVVGLVLFAGVLTAEEWKGTVKKCDPEKNCILVTVDGKDVEVILEKDGKLSGWRSLKDIKEGATVVVVGKMDGEKVKATEISKQSASKDKKEK